MPRINNAYIAPTWNDNAKPAIDAAEMQAICDSIVANQGKIAAHDDDISSLEDLISSLQTALGGKAQIQTGSYVGTGTYGEENPCSLTFDFVPKFLLIRGYALTSDSGSYLTDWWGILWEGNGYQNSYYNWDQMYDYSMTVSFDKNTVSWYEETQSVRQLNQSGRRYYYFAIG